MTAQTALFSGNVVFAVAAQLNSTQLFSKLTLEEQLSGRLLVGKTTEKYHQWDQNFRGFQLFLASFI